MKPKQKNTLLIVFAAVASYIFFVIVALHAGVLLDADPELSQLEAIVYGMTSMGDPIPLQFGAGFLKAMGGVTLVYFIIAGFVYVGWERERNTAPGKENGSADWNQDLKGYNRKYNDPYDKPTNNGPENIILSKEVSLGLNIKDPKAMRNMNTLVIGGSGAGKSRYFIKPNILQLDSNCSYVITDPSGELVTSVGKVLKDRGYKIKIFNLTDMRHSNCYNPFEYIRDDPGVAILVNTLIQNTTPGGAGKGDPFWEKSETALLSALILYLIHYRPKEEQNFNSIMKLLRAAEVDENNPNAKSPLDKLFDQVEKDDPNSVALNNYKTFKMGAGKTLKSILISCSVRLTVFNYEQVQNLTRTDNLELGKVGDEKTALFVILPQADNTYNFMASMMYSQLFETLYFHAEHECPRERLPIPVRFLLDEFANIGQIPNFVEKLSTMRKYNMGCVIVLQNLAQLKKNYEKDWEGMVGNCDSFVFLGGQEPSTCEYISKLLGKKTIKVRNNSRSRGSKGSSSLSYNSSGRELMTPDELSRMNNSDCIVIIRGVRPFYCKKYPYTEHPNYHLTGDADHANTFDFRSLPEFDNAPKVTTKDIQTALYNKNMEEVISKPKPVIEGVLDQLKKEAVAERSNPDLETTKNTNTGLTGEKGLASISFREPSFTPSQKEKRETEKEEKKEETKKEEEQEEWTFSTF